MADEPLAIPLDEIQVNDKLHFIEESVKIMDREVKRLKQSRIPIVKVMAISVILVSSDSSEDNMGTPAGRVILFGTIPTIIPDTTPSVILPTTHIDTTSIPTVSPTIPSSPDYTPISPDYSPASDTEFDPSEDPSSDHIPPLPATSPFLSSIDDSLDSDIPDTPPSPTHVDYSSSYHFSSDDSSSSSSSSSSSETSSDSSVDTLSDSASSRSSSNHSLPASPSGMRSSHHLCSLVPSVHRSSAISERPSHDSSSASLSRKRSRSPVVSVPLSSPTLRALSYIRADLLPSPKRIRSPETATDLEGCSEDRTDLEMDVDVKRSDGIEIDPEVQAKINECIAYVDALRDRGIDARVVVEAIDRVEIETGRAVKVTYETLGDLVQRFHDHTEEIPVHHVQVIESFQRDQGHRIVVTGQQSADMLERIGELERDNRRLRDIVDVKSQRVTRFWHSELHV
ncbi:hypothetical protein Tco_0499860 [Tanacetum coccineum]